MLLRQQSLLPTLLRNTYEIDCSTTCLLKNEAGLDGLTGFDDLAGLGDVAGLAGFGGLDGLDGLAGLASMAGLGYVGLRRAT